MPVMGGYLKESGLRRSCEGPLDLANPAEIRSSLPFHPSLPHGIIPLNLRHKLLDILAGLSV